MNSPKAGWGLERKLALLISGLLAVVVVVFGLAAWRQMHDASIDRSTERLVRVARQLAAGSDAGRERAASALRSIARTRELTELVTLPAVTKAGVAAAMERIEASEPDSTATAWQVWNAGEERRLATGAAMTERDDVALAAVRAQAMRTATTQRSPLYIVGDRVYYWTAVPVNADGRIAGVLAERRRLNVSPNAGRVVREIVGDEVTVYFSSVGDGDWVEATGAPAAPQFALPDTAGGAVRVLDRAGIPMFAAVGAVASTPWVVVVAQPEAAVLRRPREFMRRMLGIGAILLVIGAIAAWLVGRHVTRPLRDLTSAVSSLGQGDYDRRASVTGGAEVAHLSETFNAMATAIGEAHRQLARRNAELQEANEAKSRFLAMMSHELRTPLNAIGGYTEILELGLHGPVNETQIEDLKRIRRSRDHLLSIITDILGFSRADAGHLTLKVHAVRVRDVLAEAESVLRHQVAEKGDVRLAVEPGDEGLMARADREKLQQVVFNLLTNAIRFTEPGGTVRVWAEGTDDLVLIHVQDSGIGIAPDKLDTIFEPFVQVDESLTRRAGGTGLGLAIARELVQAMNGTVAVRSVLGEGSQFTVTLRRAHAEPDQSSSTSAERSSAST